MDESAKKLLLILFPLLFCLVIIFCVLTPGIISYIGSNSEIDLTKIDFISLYEPHTEIILSNFTQDDVWQVSRVIDGDTIEAVQGNTTVKVRLIGIDTPETKHPTKPVECYGLEAAAKLKDLLQGESVYLVSDPSQDNEDRYGRLLRYVITLEGENINLLMISAGFAYEYTYRVPYQLQSEFKEAERNARNKNLGLFGDSCRGLN